MVRTIDVEEHPAPVVDRDPRRYAVLAVLCLALLVVGIDGTIVNVALPSLVVAAVVAFLLSDDAAYVSGIDVLVHGGQHAGSTATS